MIKIDSKILCVFAHREDHIIFGWPILQDPRFKRYLLVCSSEAQDVVSKGCKNDNVISLGTVGLNNGFSYQVNRIVDSYNAIFIKIKELIEIIKPDYIFTHNPMGEYGHYDHQFLFKLIYNEFLQQKIFVTDITVLSPCYPEFRTVPRLFKHLYKDKIEDAVPNIEFYKQNAVLFNKYNMWESSPHFNLPEYPREGFGLYLLR